MSLPLQYTTSRDSPRTIGFRPNLERSDARSAEITSPAFATTVSWVTNMLPLSILVGILNRLNALSIGPGWSPVLPLGTIISDVATSPAAAGIATLDLSSDMLSSNGFMFVNMSMTWPAR